MKWLSHMLKSVVVDKQSLVKLSLMSVVSLARPNSKAELSYPTLHSSTHRLVQVA